MKYLLLFLLISCSPLSNVCVIGKSAFGQLDQVKTISDFKETGVKKGSIGTVQAVEYDCNVGGTEVVYRIKFPNRPEPDFIKEQYLEIFKLASTHEEDVCNNTCCDQKTKYDCRQCCEERAEDKGFANCLLTCRMIDMDY
jgi:hypothetical protein